MTPKSGGKNDGPWLVCWTTDHWVYDNLNYMRGRVATRGMPKEVHRRVESDWINIPLDEFETLIWSK